MSFLNIIINNKSNILIFLGFLISLVLATLFWNLIDLPYNNPDEVIGVYSNLKVSHYNNLIRFIFFTSFPLLVFLFLYLVLNKNKCTSFNEIFVEENIIIKKNFHIKICFFIFILLSIIILLIVDFPLNKLDHFHEGLSLSGAYNSYETKKLWISSYIQNSLFSDIFNAKISWFLSGKISIGSLRFNHIFLRFITEIFIIIFSYFLSKSFNYNKNKEFLFFVIICSLSLYLNREMTVDFYPNRYRDIPLIIFLIISLRLLTNNKNNFNSSLCVGILSVLSVFWSLDKGIYLNVTLFFLLLFLLLKKKNHQVLTIISTVIISWTIFFFIIGEEEFHAFIFNAYNIIKEQDLHHGLIYPPPFNFNFNEHSARGTKNLLIIIINGVLVISCLLNKRNSIPKETKIFLILFFLLSYINYKGGILRSDGYHMKQSIFLNLILFITLLYNYVINYKIINLYKKFGFLNIKIIYLLIPIFTLVTFNQHYLGLNNLKNIKNFKERYIKYVNLDDNYFLTPDYIELKNKLNNLLIKDKCFQTFTYDATIFYLVRKRSCSKYYFINAVGSKKIQEDFINELIESRPKIILIDEPLDFKSFSPQERFPYLYEFLSENYKSGEKFIKWNILYKKD